LSKQIDVVDFIAAHFLSRFLFSLITTSFIKKFKSYINFSEVSLQLKSWLLVACHSQGKLSVPNQFQSANCRVKSLCNCSKLLFSFLCLSIRYYIK